MLSLSASWNLRSKRQLLCVPHQFPSKPVFLFPFCTWFVNQVRDIKMTAVNGIPFDVSQTAPVASSAGWTRDNRLKLKDDGLVTFRQNFVKKIVEVKVASHLQVSSFEASEMENKNNFFNCVGSWSQSSLRFDSWLRTHQVKSVFNIVKEDDVPDPTNPGAAVRGIVPAGDLFQMWNAVALQEVCDSCVIVMTKTAEELEAQNLNLSWEFLMENVDEDLQAAVVSEISKHAAQNPDAAVSGPVAFHVVANRIVRTADSLAHNAVTGLVGLGLVHFKGENVTDCVSVLRNVLMFLACSANRSECPPAIVSVLTDVFLRCSVPVFVNHVRALKDFHEDKIDTPEKLFAQVQDCCDTLLTKPNGWIRTAKTRAAFVAELPELAAIVDLDPSPHAKFSMDDTDSGEKKKSAPAQKQAPSTNGGKPVVDRKGRPVDRTPPKDGQPASRKTEDGRREFWCAHEKCQRWGSHDESRHDKWFAEFKERMKKNKEAKKSAAKDDDKKQGEPPSVHAAAFCRPVLKVLRDPCDSDTSF